MTVARLGSRAIIGSFYERLETVPEPAWVPRLTRTFQSDQAAEEYLWLGASPRLRDWAHGRLAKGLRAEGLVVRNRVFEATLEVGIDELRRDKTDQVMVRVDEMADRARLHNTVLASEVIANNPVGYDGVPLVHNGHPALGGGDSQSNAITVDLSEPGAFPNGAGSPGNPSPEAVKRAVLRCIAAIMGFRDDAGEPLNETANEFVVMAAPPLMGPVLEAVKLPQLAGGGGNILTSGDFSISAAINPRMGDRWGTGLLVFRADGAVKPIIVQEEVPVSISALAEGSEEEFKNRRHLYGVERVANAAPGYWQHCCAATFSEGQ